jgi:ribosomal protein S27E
MKALIHRIKNLFVFGLILVLMNCGSDSEDPTVDCSTTTLKVALESTTQVTCSTLGTIIVSSTGGEGVIEYSIDGNNFQTSATFTDLQVEAYSITAKDNLGCTAVLATNVTGNSNGNIVFSTADVDSGCGSSGGSITVNATGGNGTYQYSLDNGTFGNSNVFGTLSTGSYEVTVQDSDLCSASNTVNVLSGIKFSTDIQNIITNSCAVSGCHIAGTGRQDFTQFSIIQSNASDIKSRTQSGNMPRTGTISEQEKAMIACWVDDGALNN